MAPDTLTPPTPTLAPASATFPVVETSNDVAGATAPGCVSAPPVVPEIAEVTVTSPPPMLVNATGPRLTAEARLTPSRAEMETPPAPALTLRGKLAVPAVPPEAETLTLSVLTSPPPDADAEETEPPWLVTLILRALTPASVAGATACCAETAAGPATGAARRLP